MFENKENVTTLGTFLALIFRPVMESMLNYRLKVEIYLICNNFKHSWYRLKGFESKACLMLGTQKHKITKIGFEGFFFDIFCIAISCNPFYTFSMN